MEVLPTTGGDFPNTQWTVIVEAVSVDPEQSRRGLEILCQAYRQPIVHWFRRKDFYQDPEDLAHSFIAHLLAKGLLVKVAPRTGKFRAFLAATMQNFLWDTWDRNNAQKRGREVEIVSLAENDADASGGGPADSQLDLDFALVIHQKVMAVLVPRPELKPYIFLKDSSEGWDEIATRLGQTPVAVRKEVSRLRRTHWEQFRAAVAQIATPANRADETRYLYELLFRNLPAE